MPAEDTAPAQLHNIPPLVYHTELMTFNEWDTRVIPSKAPRPEDLRIRSTAVYMDARGMVKYLEGMLEASGFVEAMSPADSALWDVIGKLFGHIERNRGEVEVDGRTIKKYPLESQDYLKTWWEVSSKAAARTYRNLMEMEYLYGVLHSRAYAVLVSVENWIGDMDDSERDATQKKLDKFRIKAYDDVRKSLVSGRYKVRAAKGKGD